MKPMQSTLTKTPAARRLLGLLAALCVASVPAVASAQSRGGAPVADEAAEADEYDDTDPSALTDFDKPLAPYGNWEQDSTYGRIWVPNEDSVGADFAPYQSAGRWATDDAGEWMWASDYEWGYIPFHYGRWVWAGSRWGWIPGRTYAPAWVSWRVGDAGYIGWAPLPPTYYWAGGVAVGLWNVPLAPYCFVPTNAVFNRNVGGYVVHDPAVVRTAAGGTRTYHPASPTVGSPTAHGGDHAPQHGRYPGSPTLAEAHVSPNAAARAHASADARATGYATRSSTAQEQANRSHADVGGQRLSQSRTLGQGGGRSQRDIPVARGGGGFSSYSRHAQTLRTPSYHSGAGPSGYHYAAPGGHYGQTYHPSGVAGGGYKPSGVRGGGAHVSGGHAGGGHHR